MVLSCSILNPRRGSFLLLVLILGASQQLTLIQSFSSDVRTKLNVGRNQKFRRDECLDDLRQRVRYRTAASWSACTNISFTALNGVKKRQTLILDGADFMSIASVLKAEGRLDESDSDQSIDTYEIPDRNAGYMTFVTGTMEGDIEGERILAIQKPKSANDGEQDANADANLDFFVEMEEGTLVYKDSIATIPKSISDVDAISTAAAALSARCAYGSEGGKCRTVVLGGGDYACFLAKAMECLNRTSRSGDKNGDGAAVSLVTTRPMSLKDTPLNPLRQTSGTYISCLLF